MLDLPLPAEHDGMAKTYKELQVWRKSVQLALELYRLTQNFPVEERYGLTSQLRRAGVSIPSNIAEGYGRGTRGEYKQFLCHARGSTLEVQTQLIIARELGYCDFAQFDKVDALSEEVRKMLYAIIVKL
jgi:four helix bundle protein